MGHSAGTGMRIPQLASAVNGIIENTFEDAGPGELIHRGAHSRLMVADL